MKPAYKPLSIFSIALLVSVAVQAPAYADEESTEVPTGNLVATYRPAHTHQTIKCVMNTSGISKCVQDTPPPGK